MGFTYICLYFCIVEQITEITVLPEQAFDLQALHQQLKKHLGHDVGAFRLERRSLDARHGKVRYQLRIAYALGKTLAPQMLPEPVFQNVISAPEVHVIGAGPAGYFCALELIANGLKPVIIERGKDVRNRRRDLAAITRKGDVNTDSNYCFGEGGAGTFSDGKLYSRSDKRGDLHRVYAFFVRFGADPDILVNARPHIGTNKLPEVIASMRQFILDAGGEIHFESRLTGLDLSLGRIKRIEINNHLWLNVNALVLVTGHSARDIYTLLHGNGILLEAKPFALGVRVEHPQSMIDRIQYHREERGPWLPPASYSLVQQVQGRGVYSFCMCPGGIIAPCATAPEEIVTNGWSPSKRNNPWANSGIVVELKLEDFYEKGKPADALIGMRFQQKMEQAVYALLKSGQQAPALRISDFVRQKVSADLPPCSYHPGTVPAPLWEAIPPFIYQRLQAGFSAFGKKMKGFHSSEGIAVATESRTSSPVRIPRRPDSGAHPQVDNLFPGGEGAGFAGGIASAAVDGMKIAAKVSDFLSGLKTNG